MDYPNCSFDLPATIAGDAEANVQVGFAMSGPSVHPGDNQGLGVMLGDVLEFAVPHCDPTVNLHDQYWVREDDGMVHSYWPISARGCSW